MRHIVKNSLAISSSIITVLNLIKRGIGIVTLIVALKFLTPYDLGMIAIGMLVIQFSDILSSSGIQQYLAKIESINREIRDSAWTLDILLKSLSTALVLSICTLLFLLGILDSEILILIASLSPIIIIKALVNPELYIKKRNLDYKEIFKIELVQKLSSAIILIVMIPLTKTYWAYVIADISSISIMVFLTYFLLGGRPKLNTTNFKAQWDFSKWMIPRGAIGYLRAQLDTFLLATLGTVSSLGLYQTARDIAVLPATDIVRPATEPLVSAFSRAQSKSKECLDDLVSKAITTILVLLIPICVFLYLHPLTVIYLLASEKWIGSAVLLKPFSILLIVYSINPVLTNLLIAKSKVRALFAFESCTLLASTIALYFLYTNNLENFATLRTVIAGLVLLSLVSITRSNITLPIRRVLLITYSLTCSIFASIISSYILNEVNYDLTTNLLLGFIYVVFAAISFVTPILIFKIFIRKETINQSIRSLRNVI